MSTWVELYGWFWPGIFLAIAAGLFALGGYVTYRDIRRLRSTNSPKD